MNSSPNKLIYTDEHLHAVSMKLAAAFAVRRSQGLIAYQGRWLEPEQLQEALTVAQRKSKQILLELSLLFTLIFGASLFLLLLLVTLVY